MIKKIKNKKCKNKLKAIYKTLTRIIFFNNKVPYLKLKAI